MFLGCKKAVVHHSGPPTSPPGYILFFLIPLRLDSPMASFDARQPCHSRGPPYQSSCKEQPFDAKTAKTRPFCPHRQHQAAILEQKSNTEDVRIWSDLIDFDFPCKIPYLGWSKAHHFWVPWWSHEGPEFYGRFRDPRKQNPAPAFFLHHFWLENVAGVYLAPHWRWVVVGSGSPIFVPYLALLFDFSREVLAFNKPQHDCKSSPFRSLSSRFTQGYGIRLRVWVAKKHTHLRVLQSTT